MYSFLQSLTLFYGIFGSAFSAEPKAQILFADDDILLKLDYATYRGYYNKTNNVI
jgi:hypothetical protein